MRALSLFLALAAAPPPACAPVSVFTIGENLAGYSAKMEFKAEPNQAALLTLETGKGITISVAADNTSTLAFDAFHLPESPYPVVLQHDLLLVSPSGHRRTYLKGRIMLDGNITGLRE